MELRVSAINPIGIVCGLKSIYAKELYTLKSPNVFLIKGVLEAAREDYSQGFLANQKLLASAEVFDDQINQADELLENDYKDALAVILRSVLESGLLRLCEANGIEVRKKDGIGKLNEYLYKAGILSKLQFSEVETKKEIGNSAAHGRPDEYTKEDVLAFIEFVRRFLGEKLV